MADLYLSDEEKDLGIDIIQDRTEYLNDAAPTVNDTVKATEFSQLDVNQSISKQESRPLIIRQQGVSQSTNNSAAPN